MGLNDTGNSERVHIGLFGKRNAGKSSIINAVTDQNIAIVSEVKGTTTDPVYKAMELLPIGPVVIIDTPGLDDEGELGMQRIEKTNQVLNKTDIAILVVDANEGLTDLERELIDRFIDKKIPYVTVFNKLDELKQADPEKAASVKPSANEIYVSATTKENIHELKELLPKLMPKDEEELRVIGDLLNPGDKVILVCPIDSAAPKGRLILPQTQTIRDILDSDAIALVTKENTLKETIEGLAEKPRMVITDSQVFPYVSEVTPLDIPLTSFSIIMARYKGNIYELISGLRALSSLKDGDRILISEGCSHHRQCEDIGTVKIPAALKKKTGKDLIISTSSGTAFPQDLKDYAMVVHCGGCMLNRREMQHRIKLVSDQEVPIVNYGILLAYVAGILERSIEPFPELAGLLKGSDK